MRRDFAVTFETVTEESVREGDAADRGYVGQGLTLREALEECSGDYVEADTSPVTLEYAPRWLTWYPGSPDQHYNGEDTSYTLHIPDSVTPSSRLRIARLVGCYGIRS